MVLLNYVLTFKMSSDVLLSELELMLGSTLTIYISSKLNDIFDEKFKGRQWLILCYGRVI